jgi:hypothetical protein
MAALRGVIAGCHSNKHLQTDVTDWWLYHLHSCCLATDNSYICCKKYSVQDWCYPVAEYGKTEDWWNPKKQHFGLPLINLVNQSTSSRSAKLDITPLLWNPRIHNCVHIIPSFKNTYQ